MKVEKLMSSWIVTCKPSHTLDVVAQKMWDHDVGFLPVIDDAGKVVGAITDRDLAMAALLSGRPLSATHVEQVSSLRVVSCRPQTEVVEAAQLMRSARVRRLPVVDGSGRLQGVITIGGTF